MWLFKKQIQLNKLLIKKYKVKSLLYLSLLLIYLFIYNCTHEMSQKLNLEHLCKHAAGTSSGAAKAHGRLTSRSAGFCVSDF